MNVLRSVALSTNSVAASVEPVMQQQFMSLSPMAGQESFGQHLDVNRGQAMLHTPTTSSMLAALQADSFAVDSFAADFVLPSYMDTSPAAPDDVMPGSLSQSSGMSFHDFAGSSNAFDVSAAFTPSDLSLSTGGTPGANHDGEELSSAVEPKVETPASS
jgi:regulatory factor X